MIPSKTGIIVNELFQSSLITYLLLLLWDIIDKGAISNVINLNLLLAIVIISGIIKILPISQKKNLDQWEIIDQNFWSLTLKVLKPKTISENEFYFIVIIGFSGGMLVYYKTASLGLIAIAIGVITTIIIFLLSYLIYTENENEEDVK
jgi:hypothetical protein